MQVRDLLEILNRFDPTQRLRVLMDGLHTGENGPSCRFSDDETPEVSADAEGTIVLKFSDQ